jgi:flavin reductase (DIM6/NTAB) family NADH-FMN oxidoreductase RutF
MTSACRPAGEVQPVGTQTGESVRAFGLTATGGVIRRHARIQTGPKGLLFSSSHLQQTAIMAPSNSFREVMGQFATGVTVITMDADGLQHGMTANAFSSVSMDPPLVLFCADVDTNCHSLVPDAGHYAVNVLSEDQEWLSDRFAGEHHDMEDPFHDVATRDAETGAPIIEDTLAYIDCRLHESHEAGDHTIYVGEVEAMEVDRDDADPLTFFRGEYGTIQ